MGHKLISHRHPPEGGGGWGGGVRTPPYLLFVRLVRFDTAFVGCYLKLSVSGLRSFFQVRTGGGGGGVGVPTPGGYTHYTYVTYHIRLYRPSGLFTAYTVVKWNSERVERETGVGGCGSPRAATQVPLDTSSLVSSGLAAPHLHQSTTITNKINNMFFYLNF